MPDYISFDSSNINNDTQFLANQNAQLIKSSIENDDNKGFLEGIQKLRNINMSQVSNPYSIVIYLFDALLCNKGTISDMMMNYRDLLVQLILQFSMRTYLQCVEKKKSLPPLYRKEISSFFASAFQLIQQDKYFQNPLQFSLESAKLALESIDATN